MPGPDDIGGNGADGIKRLRTDRVDHYAFADLLRIETCAGEALGQRRVLIGTDLRAAHVVRAVTGAHGIFVLTGPGQSTESPTLVPCSSCSSASECERAAYFV